MAKKKSAAATAAAAAKAAAVQAVPVVEETESSAAATAGDGTVTLEDNVTDELELLQVDLGDMVKLKQVLDECVADSVLEHLPEDYAWDNTKLLIMVAACIFAVIAQFCPIPFPESRPVLGVCGSLYFVLSGVLQLIATFVDRDTIMWTQKLTDSNRKEGVVYKNKDLEKFGVRVRSSLPRFSEWYTVTLEFHVKGGSNKKGAPPSAVSQTWSVGQFFDKEGYFDETGLTLEIDKLFERLNTLDKKKAE